MVISLLIGPARLHHKVVAGRAFLGLLGSLPLLWYG